MLDCHQHNVLNVQDLNELFAAAYVDPLADIKYVYEFFNSLNADREIIGVKVSVLP